MSVLAAVTSSTDAPDLGSYIVGLLACAIIGFIIGLAVKHLKK